MSERNGSPQFPLGQVVATPGALSALEESGQSPQQFLTRHVRLEQGDLCTEDHDLNSEAIENGSRILSSYSTSKDVKLWIITEAADDCGNRAATTLLLPEEY